MRKLWEAVKDYADLLYCLCVLLPIITIHNRITGEGGFWDNEKDEHNHR